MLNSLRILDSECQLVRTFGSFKLEYDTIQKANGLYDIIFTHRELMQDNFESILQYCKPTTKIVTDISTESGNIGVFLNNYKEITSKYQFQFYFISDAIIPNSLKFNNNVKILHSYEIVFYAFLNKYSDNLMTIDNTLFAENHEGFMSLNNSCRIHRVYLFTQLLKRNLSLDNCSFLFSTGASEGFSYNREVFKDGLEYLYSNNFIDNSLLKLSLEYSLPKTLDYDNVKPIYISNEITDVYRNCILNLVSENTTGMMDGDLFNGIITFTEKTIKPFQAKQIPLYFSSTGHLKLIKSLGFDLFDDLVDNSYDDESDPIKRLDMILNELEKLISVDLVEYKKINQIRFDKNYDLLETLNKSGEELVKSFLYDEILK